jgi:hypothetical protein
MLDMGDVPTNPSGTLFLPENLPQDFGRFGLNLVFRVVGWVA